ncbi:MAG TPA: fibronectin type III domain-containing protein, partial [Rhodothermia bacterium]
MRLLKRNHIVTNLTKRVAIVACGLLLISRGALAQAPAAPSDVRLRIVRDNAIDVLWQDNSNNESAFDVFRRSGGGGSTLLGAVDANITLYPDRNSNIRPNVEFCYRVSARNASGSNSSPETCVTVPPRPNPPTNLQVSRIGQASPIVLSWADNSGNETDFLVYRDTGGAAFVLYDTVDANVTIFSDFVLRTQGTYCYFVSAINASGESAGTDSECIDVVGDPP